MAHLLHHPLLDPSASWLDLPNLLTFAKKDEGGSGDDDAEGDDEDDDEDEEDEDTSKKSDDGDDEDDEDESEKDLPDNVKALLREARKNARAASKRATAAEAKARIAAKKSKAGDGDDEADKVAEAEARGAKKGETIAINASVRAALVSNGLSVGDDAPRALKRAMRLIDVEDLTLNDDGTVDGLDDAIDDLKEEMPSLFRKPKRQRGNINGGDTRDGKGTSKTPKTSAEKLASRLG